MAIYRKPKLTIVSNEEFPENIHASGPITVSENEERMFAALRSLNDAEKAIVSLFLEDFSYREIADITGLSESNVGVRLNWIKNKLKKILN